MEALVSPFALALYGIAFAFVLTLGWLFLPRRRGGRP
jgi:hypothetical protein